jgi:hypothetical protein
MSFTRVKPAGWAVGEKLTSTEMNGLDIDHENSVDKTGDTITGTVGIGAAGKIQSSTAGSLIEVTSSGKLELKGNATFEQTSGTSEIKLYREPSYNPNLNVKIRYPLVAPGGGIGGWTAGDHNTYTADTNGDTWPFLLLGFLPEKATIEYVSVGVAIAGAHVGVPASQPRVQVYRRNTATATNTLIAETVMSAATIGAYEGTTEIVVDCTASANKTVDKETYVYFVTLRGESGANAVTGAVFKDAQFTLNLVKLGGY